MLKIKGIDWGFIVVFFVAGLLVAAGAPVPTGSVEVDRTPAFTVGSRPVSRYLLDKYHGRFVQGFQSQHRRRPDEAESEAWLELYVAQQEIIAKAATEGYLDRPEVKHTVARMQRLMLTQLDGPLYDDLAPAAQPTEEELKRLFADAAVVVDAEVVRFPEEARMEWSDGFSALPAEEQAKRIANAGQQAGVERLDRKMAWPYEPVAEIAPVIAEAPTGRWTLHAEPGFGTYAIFVRERKLRPAPPFETVRAGFSGMIARMDREKVQKKRRLAVLRGAKVTVNDAVAGRVLAFCEALPTTLGPLPDMPSGLGDAIFFRYHADGRELAVSAGMYWRNLSDLIFRRVPESEAALRASVGDYVVGEIDLALAHAKGIDATPKFTEDRQGFAGLQALDLYEKEVLQPGIAIGADEIAAYYREHAPELSAYVPIRGTLREFRDGASAEAWLRQQGEAKSAGAAAAVQPVSEREIEFSAQHPIPGLERLQGPLTMAVTAKEPRPFAAGNAFYVFVRDPAGNAHPENNPQVQQAIRYRLVRQALDAKERQLGVTLLAQFPVTDRIDYAQLGITEPGRLFWRKGSAGAGASAEAPSSKLQAPGKIQ